MNRKGKKSNKSNEMLSLNKALHWRVSDVTEKTVGNPSIHPSTTNGSTNTPGHQTPWRGGGSNRKKQDVILSLKGSVILTAGMKAQFLAKLLVVAILMESHQ
ncbi:hypothetical protein CEXT_538661 [Caerostris extrusa]|uniref:Uncharacterized protein n=1 Tax=Caerostris extrusa TaxID=172846 RepID=A0AAV4Y6Q8_CAEEX|nr:hypothetical protein CEXT_538661 [Caerostris extrusa]